MKFYTHHNFKKIPQLKHLNAQELHVFEVLIRIFPFKVNEYVLNHLIDWKQVPNDPMYQLTFPQREMLQEEDFKKISTLLQSNEDKQILKKTIQDIHIRLNPHCSNQSQNLGNLNGEIMQGIQHKYKETILFFPQQGQTCFSYCTFCFRWPQFVTDQIRFAEKDVSRLHRYVQEHTEVTDILFTGGDPLIMPTRMLKMYFQPFLDCHYPHIKTIRIGTKALSYWPMRFLEDEDSDELLNVFQQLQNKGIKIALMAHFNHWKELESPLVQKAIHRLQEYNILIRSQSPILRHINDNSETWVKMWKKQIQLNIIPYYMFIERDTGPHEYFELPLVTAWRIYQKAIQQLSGLARTARGPVMSTSYGKIEIQGVSTINQEHVFVLRFIQARNPKWVQQPFFAKYDPTAVWFDQLKPAFNESIFFFQTHDNNITQIPNSTLTNAKDARDKKSITQLERNFAICLK